MTTHPSFFIFFDDETGKRCKQKEHDAHVEPVGN